uniref:Methylmalonic aciduria and homocystinuria type D protein, mitochondrial n=1 Tax=Caenorhabditis japonica TaxID=281687 RepID=A0A8R1DJY1_CAEJA
MLTVKGPQMRAFTQRIAAFSTQVQVDPRPVVFVGKGTTPRQNSLLGPNDSQYPFQGDVAFPHRPINLRQKVENARIEKVLEETEHTLINLLSATNVELDRVHLAQLKNDALEEIQANAADVEIELSAVDCPRLLKREMKYLFPRMETQKLQNVTIFNLTQKTEFDMRAWSEAMEEEREKLTASFIMSANAICDTLAKFGYWADFIDPSSGRPYLGDYTNHTLFETNEAYKQMGFKIEDLGCCKVLQHACWGSNAFVGTIFTDAPLDSSAVTSILKKVSGEDL